jgi:antitoxin component of MazEF toxin-antitoxin module
MLHIAWTGMLIDVGDSSGDAMLELPDDLLAQLNWQIDDELNVSMNTRGELVLTKYIA